MAMSREQEFEDVYRRSCDRAPNVYIAEHCFPNISIEIERN